MRNLTDNTVYVAALSTPLQLISAAGTVPVSAAQHGDDSVGTQRHHQCHSAGNLSPWRIANEVARGSSRCGAVIRSNRRREEIYHRELFPWLLSGDNTPPLPKTLVTNHQEIIARIK